MKMNGLVIIIFVGFATSLVSANLNTSKSQKYRSVLYKCTKKYPDDEAEQAQCVKEERLAAIRAAIAKDSR